MSSPSAVRSAPAAGASSASCWWKPSSSPDGRRPWRCCVVLAGKASHGAFSGFLSGRIRHSHQRSHPRILRRARAALRHPLRSCSRIASLASRFRARCSPAGRWRCGCSRKASLEHSHRRASRAHTASHGHCGHRHPQLSSAHADAAWLRSRKCHEDRHRAAHPRLRRVEPHPVARSASRLHRANPGEDRIRPRRLHCRCRRAMPRRPIWR